MHRAWSLSTPDATTPPRLAGRAHKIRVNEWLPDVLGRTMTRLLFAAITMLAILFGAGCGDHHHRDHDRIKFVDEDRHDDHKDRDRDHEEDHRDHDDHHDHD